jgi:ATP-dependent protease ClpP protease subunit
MKTVNKGNKGLKLEVSPLTASDLWQEEFEIERTLHWMGSVNHDSYMRITSTIKELLVADKEQQINLIVTSPGGPTGVAMSFFDLMKNVYKPNLQTIGSGDVDSAGIILFLTGKNRLITPNTTMLLHLAGRTFDGARRFSTADMESMLKEDSLKDYQYASVVASVSGKMRSEEVLALMTKNTVLTAAEAVELGIAHQVLQ